MKRWVAAAAALLAACGTPTRPTLGESPGSVSASAGATATATTVSLVAAPTGSTAPVGLGGPVTSTATTTSSNPTLAPVTTAAPPYTSDVVAIDDSVRDRMPFSWRPGCPVALAQLRLVKVTFWGFDDRAHRGELVVHAAQADNIAWAFGELYNARFPIERIELVDVYDGNDDRSMVANNTSAFNCREVAGRPGVLSQHSFGTAIDINPLINPWVRGSRVDPPEGAPYADRSVNHKGAIYDGDVVVRTFAAIGWGWGGHWPDSKDYQHFSSTGR